MNIIFTSKARAAGFFWLITFIAGAFAMSIGGRLVVSGDAAATTANILASESAFRLGTAGNLIATVCYLATTLLVYELLKPVNRTVSLLAASLSLVGCGLGALVVLLNFAPLVFLGGASYLNVFSTNQLQALALVSFRLALRANEVGLVFFGLHIFLVGSLIVRSDLVPRALGLLLALGGICYLTNSFASFLGAPFARLLFPFILLPAFFAELALSLWLLIKGANEPFSRRALPNGLTMTAILCLGFASPTFALQSSDALKQRVLAQTQTVGSDD